MLRSVLLLLLLPASCAGSATETAACDPTSGDTCINDRAGGDYQSHLQNRVKMELDGTNERLREEQMETDKDEAVQTMGGDLKVADGKCDDNDDTNCCFTAAGIEFARKNGALADGMKAGMCAVGAKDVSPSLAKWKEYVGSLAYVKTCDKDQCTNRNTEALKVEKGSASGTCSDFKCPAPTFVTKTPAKDALCTNKDECEFNCCKVNINARKNERTEILTFATVMVLKNATAIITDMETQRGNPKHDIHADVAALKGSMTGLENVMAQTDEGKDCVKMEISHIKSCVHIATCIIEKDVDPAALGGDQLKTYTLLVELYDKFSDITWDKTVVVLKNKSVAVGGNFDFVTPAELGCSGLKKPSFLEADNEEQQAAYRVSAALVDAAKTTHAVLDAHMANSSVDETVAALHQAWKVPCEMLDCDHTNYWDLLGASHRHSLALIESGASAHHMRVHVGVRTRLEHRMQSFLGTGGNLFADRIIRVEGTKTEAHAKTYIDALFEAVRRMWTEHPKKYGASSLLLSLVPREQIHAHARTDLQKQAVQAILDDNLIMASKKATLYHMMEERGLSVSDETDGEEEEPSSLVEGSSRLDRSLGRKGFVKTFESIGKGLVSIGKAVGGAIVTGFTALGTAIVTVATAIGNVVGAFIDFVLSMFSCFGFGIVGQIAYTKVLDAIYLTIKLGVSCGITDGLTGIFGGQLARAIGVALNVGVTLGKVMLFGLTTGVGITAGVACGVNSATGGSCVFSFGVGVTASASVPKEANPMCPFGTSILTAECAESYGITVKIMCCNVNLVTGCNSCGSGCSDSSTGSADAATQAVTDDAQNSDGDGSCEENLSGKGTGYRGCQYQTLSGRQCQKWSAQQPHTHGLCSHTWKTLAGETDKGTQIKAIHGLCLHSGQRNKNGGNVNVWGCSVNNAGQQWRYETSEQGRLKLKSGKCLDASQRNKNGGRVHIWDCNSNNYNQQWTVAGQQIKNTHGKCLDAGQRNRNGGTVHMWDCNQNNKNQQWELNGNTAKVWCESDSDTAKGLGDHNLCRNPNSASTIWCFTTDEHKRWENCGAIGTGLTSGSNKQIKATHGKCLHSGQRNRNGGNVNVWGCNTNNLGQRWTVTISTKQLKITDGKCLDSNQRNRNGGNIHMWSCETNNDNQKWSIDGEQIKATYGKCLDASQRNRNGGTVHMWSCETNNNNQKWTIS